MKLVSISIDSRTKDVGGAPLPQIKVRWVGQLGDKDGFVSFVKSADFDSIGLRRLSNSQVSSTVAVAGDPDVIRVELAAGILPAYVDVIANPNDPNWICCRTDHRIRLPGPPNRRNHHHRPRALQLVDHR